MEIGAGYGTFSKRIFPYLDEFNEIKYDFTDISKFFLDKAKLDFSNYNFINYDLYDINKPVGISGVKGKSYDIILAVSMLHDASDLEYSLTELHSILNPGGLLFLIEETKFHPFFNLGMGLQSGFDDFKDYRRKLSTNPLLSTDDWCNILEKAGFSKTLDITPAKTLSSEIGFNLLISQKAGIGNINSNKLREYCNDNLPHYMVPSVYGRLKKIPLTPNGKISYEELPKIKIHQYEFVAPRSEIEEKLCKIWQESLGLDRVGITDDFFELGGDSLLATRVVNLMQNTISHEVTIADIFKLRTINKILPIINKDSKNNNTIDWYI